METLQDAHDVMERTLSSSVAPRAFGMALLCAGQLSTFTGTIAGQVGHMGSHAPFLGIWKAGLRSKVGRSCPACVAKQPWILATDN